MISTRGGLHTPLRRLQAQELRRRPWRILKMAVCLQIDVQNISSIGVRRLYTYHKICVQIYDPSGASVSLFSSLIIVTCEGTVWSFFGIFAILFCHPYIVEASFNLFGVFPLCFLHLIVVFARMETRTALDRPWDQKATYVIAADH